jgi:hypothetical protein
VAAYVYASTHWAGAPGQPLEPLATIAAMAYDEVLAGRIRALLAKEPALTEQRMFGGLAFLIGGNMAVSASGQGGALVHVDPEEGQRLIATSAAEPMEMRGRQMRGWLRLDSAQLLSEADLAKWVALGAAHARSLPPK